MQEETAPLDSNYGAIDIPKWMIPILEDDGLIFDCDGDGDHYHIHVETDDDERAKFEEIKGLVQ